MGIFDEAFTGLHNLFGDKVNELAVNHIATRTSARPRPFSLWSADPVDTGGDCGPVGDYTSWPGLTDRSFSGRHLAPVPALDIARQQSKPEDLVPLFMRTGPMVEDRSSVLFMFFAQWFTDSVLRVDPKDRRRNTSNHEIDLCQIYGLHEPTTCLLRSKEGGRLRSQQIKGEEFPDYLYEQSAPGTPLQVKAHFQDLSYVKDLDFIFQKTGDMERRRKAYATGLERGNSTIGYAAINTLFLREHNRIAGELGSHYPSWNDERRFQTARMINIVLLMKVVVEDYINHIAGVSIFELDVGFAEKQRWYRQNWIAVEFDLLYRWHSLVPDRVKVGADELGPLDFLVNNGLLEDKGLAAILTSASAQRAGRIGLHNTPAFLKDAELATLKMNRSLRLQPYNAYRAQFGFSRHESFEELTRDPAVLASLKASYQSINDVEFIVGIFAEDRSGKALFGDLLSTMVAYDAFTQIYTNPLLSSNVYTPQTLTPYGLGLIKATRSVQDIARRNVAGGDVRAALEA